MNLIIDIGNTSIKAAIYKNGTLIKKGILNDISLKSVESFLGKTVAEKAIISSVAADPSGLISILSAKTGNVHNLTWRSRLPFIIKYDTPETLGVDRLAAAAGAVLYHPGKNILVIDAGSAITFDIVAAGVYQGGSISPGMKMRFRALQEYTGRLPLVEYNDTFTFPGTSTVDAISGGVLMGMVFEVDDYVHFFKKKYSTLVPVITGGDAEILKVKAGMEIKWYPDLVTDGLNYILDLNSVTKTDEQK